jgi:hypothetical protein
MKSIFLKISCLLMVSLASTSCKKNSTPTKTALGFGDISYFAKATGTAVKTAAIKSNSILSDQVDVDWVSATIYIEKISFVGNGSNQIDTTISVERKINLFSSDALAGIIQLPTGSYKDVKVKLLLRKSPKSDLAFYLKGTFMNLQGQQDSLLVASSYPFEVNLGITDITINASDKYKAIFSFDLDKGLTGISTASLQTARSRESYNHPINYVIWKGGSQDEPFYDQVVANWQNVASVIVSKE